LLAEVCRACAPVGPGLRARVGTGLGPICTALPLLHDIGAIGATLALLDGVGAAFSASGSCG
jgi:hypothetical protein